MYQSMFLLGVIAFGVFAYTFNVYTDRAEELTLESNVELTNQKVGTLLLELIGEGENMQSHSSQFEISVNVYLDSVFARKSYYLELEISGSDEVLINAVTSGTTVSTFNTGYIGSGDISFDTSQIMVSDNPGQYIYYRYNALTGTTLVGFGAI